MVSSAERFLVNRDLIKAALWIETHMRRHPRLVTWIIPTTAREFFYSAVRNYKQMIDKE